MKQADCRNIFFSIECDLSATGTLNGNGIVLGVFRAKEGRVG
jgi:hypothetical protein